MPLKRTSLYNIHSTLNARIVDFAGWEMPLHYPTGIQKEHIGVRQTCGIFDVSHMGEVRITGEDSVRFLGYATLNDPTKLRVGRGQYSMLPNNKGGLVDDIYIYCEGEKNFLIVCNASNIQTVIEHLEFLANNFVSKGYTVAVNDESDHWALLALQGPDAKLLISHELEFDIAKLNKNRLIETKFNNYAVIIARTGYTGEDGFEIFCNPENAVGIWKILIELGAMPCGLGSRDTLRLEAGFPLYGHEFTVDTNPLCSHYAWVVKGKDFYGCDVMCNPSCEQRLVGIRLQERGIARQGYNILDDNGNIIGRVTSGTISPLTKDSIALGWVNNVYADVGQKLNVEIRGKAVPANVSKLPFYKNS